MAQKICLVVGAGCTVADALSLPKKERPPLDKGFFSIANKTNSGVTNKIKLYITEIYGLDILLPENDSLETVMAKVYTDIFDPKLKDEATKVFRVLISLFNRRLANTTNSLPATRKRYLYRIISDYLRTGVEPEDITIITFNQDIQIEKILNKLEKTESYKSKGKIFNFPFCYSIDFDAITAPTGHRKELFDEGDKSSKGIKLLKLHGSLNWYSLHTSPNISPIAMFREDRRIKVTRRQTINTQMRYVGGRHSQCTLPVIVPPVSHKSGILHNRIRTLWAEAEKALKTANEILIIGYSCPAMDFESSNLVQRSLKDGGYEVLWVIDPDPRILMRYVELIKPEKITYFPYAHDYLESRR